MIKEIFMGMPSAVNIVYSATVFTSVIWVIISSINKRCRSSGQALTPTR